MHNSVWPLLIPAYTVYESRLSNTSYKVEPILSIYDTLTLLNFILSVKFIFSHIIVFYYMYHRYVYNFEH